MFINKTIKFIFSILDSDFRVRIVKALSNNLNIKEKELLGLTDLSSSLQRIKSIGFTPTLIIDVGAHNGSWAKTVSEIYDKTPFLVVEALPQKYMVLQKELQQDKFKIYNCLLGDKEKKDVPFFSMGTGSSVMEELSNVPREKINLNMRTLDSIMMENSFAGNQVFLKLDVQGFELEVLKGSEKTLDLVELLCLEVSFLNYNKNAPLIAEVVLFLNNLNFIPFDFVEFNRKTSDQSLIQADMLFIKKDSLIRKKINQF